MHVVMPQAQLAVIHAVQSVHSPLLDRIAIGLSAMGTEAIYVLLLPLILWAGSRRFGLRLLYVFLCSIYFNAWLKDAWLVPRPIGQPGVRSILLNSARDPSMPSGHAQAPLTFLFFLCASMKKAWFWGLSCLLIVLIGISRIYLGLHWPLDVLTGWALGILAVVIGLWACAWFASIRRVAARLALAVAVPTLLLLVQDGPASLQYAAYLLGIGVGAVVLDACVDCDLDGLWWKRICTCVIGIAGMVALQWGVRWPGTETGLLFRCSTLGLWGTLGAPLVFLWLGLYERVADRRARG